MRNRYRESRSTMRRRVRAAGGYFNRQTGWVLPGRSSRYAGSPRWDTQWFATLEDIYDACDRVAERRRAADQWDEEEAALLRQMRRVGS